MKIFISCRGKCAGLTARVGDELASRFGKARVFRFDHPVHSHVGGSFPKQIENEIACCDVMVLLVGRRWTDEAHRLHDPADWVRKEIEAGLRDPDRLIVPVLLDAVPLLKPEHLPDPLKALTSLKSYAVRDEDDFYSDFDAVAAVIARRAVRSRRRLLTVAALLAAVFALLAVGLWQGGLLAGFGGSAASPRASRRPGPGEWASDDRVAALLPAAAKGTVLSETTYDLPLALENRTSMEMYVTKVEVDFRNASVAARLGFVGDRVYHSEVNCMTHLAPHAQASVRVPGNEILPARATIRILHNLAAEPAEFDVDLGGEILPMPAPRTLPPSALFAGVDGLSAVRRAAGDVHSWSPDAFPIALMEGDTETYLEPRSRLKHVVVKWWVATWYSPSKDMCWAAFVKPEGIQGGEAPGPRRGLEKPPGRVAEPLLGNQDALARCSRAGLLCGDWKDGPRFQVVEIDAGWTSAWFLPYLGPDGLPLTVDAETGDLLVYDGPLRKRRSIP